MRHLIDILDLSTEEIKAILDQADEIIAQHGGTLELDSEESVGTTVTITIPTVDSL